MGRARLDMFKHPLDLCWRRNDGIDTERLDQEQLPLKGWRKAGRFTRGQEHERGQEAPGLLKSGTISARSKFASPVTGNILKRSAMALPGTINFLAAPAD